MRKENTRAILKAILTLKKHGEVLTPKLISKESSVSLQTVYKSRFVKQYVRTKGVKAPRLTSHAEDIENTESSQNAPEEGQREEQEAKTESVPTATSLVLPELPKETEPEKKKGLFFVRFYHESAHGTKFDLCILRETKGNYKEKIRQTMEHYLEIMQIDEQEKNNNKENT